MRRIRTFPNINETRNNFVNIETRSDNNQTEGIPNENMGRVPHLTDKAWQRMCSSKQITCRNSTKGTWSLDVKNIRSICPHDFRQKFSMSIWTEILGKRKYTISFRQGAQWFFEPPSWNDRIHQFHKVNPHRQSHPMPVGCIFLRHRTICKIRKIYHRMERSGMDSHSRPRKMAWWDSWRPR